MCKDESPRRRTEIGREWQQAHPGIVLYLYIYIALLQCTPITSAPVRETQREEQWSNYQKISKGAHTIVNANEAMLLITGGSRNSESGDKFFPKFFYHFLRAFLKIFFHFSPKNVHLFSQNF